MKKKILLPIRLLEKGALHCFEELIPLKGH
jgi:hypothetical protein